MEQFPTWVNAHQGQNIQSHRKLPITPPMDSNETHPATNATPAQADYKGDLHCDGCDDLDAEVNCTNRIKGPLIGYITDLAGSYVPKTVINLIVSGVGLFTPPVGWIAGGITLVDGIAGVAVTYSNIVTGPTATWHRPRPWRAQSGAGAFRGASV